MKQASAAGSLAEAVLAGSERGLSRGLTCVERRGEAAEELLEQIYPHTGRAHVVGITGSPGSGKSTLVRALTREARARGLTVGVLAVDPSSPFSGGAILGDRVRMSDVAQDAGVFIRSLATRGALGGLSRAAADSIDLMDAAGKQIIFVETVGVGQDEVDVMQIVHTVVVVSVPGLGDEIQTLKAGILEIADIHAVNKADREGAERMQVELRAMLSLADADERAWKSPVLACIATQEQGTGELLDAVQAHARHLHESGEMALRLKRMVRERVLGIARDLVSDISSRQQYDTADVLDRVARRELAPRAAGRALLARLAESQRKQLRGDAI